MIYKDDDMRTHREEGEEDTVESVAGNPLGVSEDEEEETPLGGVEEEGEKWE